MKTTHVLRTALTRAMLFLLLLALSVLQVGVEGCRHKTPVGPDTSNTPTGHWSLTLHGPRVMYRDRPGGHVLNYDSITVRVYDPNGRLRGGILVHSQCDVSRDSISTQVTTQSDTATNWRGCDPYLTYWGTGGFDGADVIRSYVVADSDTVRAALGFKVRDPS